MDNPTKKTLKEKLEDPAFRAKWDAPKISDKNQYYQITLVDCATPSYITWPKPYWGTLQDIMELAAEADLGGVPELRSVVLLHKETVTLENHQWEHINVWDSIYKIRCEKVVCEAFWFWQDGTIVRCIKSKFTNLEVHFWGSLWRFIKHGTWGHPGQIVIEKPYLWNRLAVKDKLFASEEEARADWEKFKEAPDINFSEVCNDIFGDG